MLGKDLAPLQVAGGFVFDVCKSWVRKKNIYIHIYRAVSPTFWSDDFDLIFVCFVVVMKWLASFLNWCLAKEFCVNNEFGLPRVGCVSRKWLNHYLVLYIPIWLCCWYATSAHLKGSKIIPPRMSWHVWFLHELAGWEDETTYVNPIWIKSESRLLLPTMKERTKNMYINCIPGHGNQWKSSSISFISGTQMTLVFYWNFGLVLEGWSPNIEDKQVPGIYIWMFPKIGVPPKRWFIMENPMIWGYHYFWKYPYNEILE